MARRLGTLVHWDDDRGFGFIEGTDRQRVFVHISEIERIATRPRIGDQISFETGPGRNGKPEARMARIAGANPVGMAGARRQQPASIVWLGWRSLAAGALTLALLLAIAAGHAPVWLAIAYGGMGAWSFLFYRADKGFAETGQWRVSEALLLSVDLACGILGGLLAQQMFRHKTRKPSFIAMTGLVVLVHAFWLVGLAGGWISEAQVIDLVRDLGSGALL